MSLVQRSSKRSARGFTLLEILVAVALFSIFMLTLSKLIVGGMDSFRRGQALSLLRSDLKSSLEQISSEFRAVNGVSGVLAPKVSDGYNKSDTLQFDRTVNKPETSQTLFSNPTTTVTYELDASTNTLVRSDTTDNVEVVIAENILTGEQLGVSGGNSPSFFRWTKNPTATKDAGYPDYVMEMRLAGATMAGADELRMGVNIFVNVRSRQGDSDANPYTSTTGSYSSSRLDFVPFVKHSVPSSLSEPSSHCFRR